VKGKGNTMKFMSYLLMSAVLFGATSCLNQEEGKYIPGVNGPHVNIQNGKILLSVELTAVDTPVGVTVTMPKMKNSDITISPAMQDDGSVSGTLLRVAFDLKDVDSDEFNVVPHETLPDGRPFPFLVEGTLPALAINVPKAKNATFYASKKVFGFFLPIKLPVDFNVSVHYRIKINGKNYGVVSLIHPDASGEGAGVVALLTLEELRNNPDVQKLLKISKKRKNRLY
jgi:hypothetical protein